VMLPVLVISAAHFRFVLGRMIPTRRTEDLLTATWEFLQEPGRVPRRLIWDNEPGIGRGRRHAEGAAACRPGLRVWRARRDSNPQPSDP
jgi:hypothetical protein